MHGERLNKSSEEEREGTRGKRGKGMRKKRKAVGEAQGRLGEEARDEKQGEVRWNAVTVDRGPVLVQVLCEV